MMLEISNEMLPRYAVFTTTIRLRFDGRSTAYQKMTKVTVT